MRHLGIIHDSEKIEDFRENENENENHLKVNCIVAKNVA